MKKLIIYLISTLFVVVVVDVFFGLSMQFYLKHYKLPGDYRSIDYVVNEAKEDIIIIGSSVALHSIIPTIVEDSLKLTCYNGAANGQQLPYYKTMIGYILKRYSPKMIILGITPDVCSFPGVGERYNILVPYYKRGNQYLDSCMESTMSFGSLFLKSNLIRYNTIWWRILLYHFISPDNQGKNGFVGKDAPQVLPTLTETRMDQPMLKERKEQMKQIINDCKKHSVKIVICLPPQYTKFIGPNPCAKSLESICVENHISFMDDSQDSVFLLHPEWFHDNLHLNEIGAMIYTNIFIEKLKQMNSNVSY